MKRKLNNAIRKTGEEIETCASIPNGTACLLDAAIAGNYESYYTWHACGHNWQYPFWC